VLEQGPMPKRNAASFFRSLAWKRLRKIDLPNHGSNQHELQGITPLRDMLGTSGPQRIRAIWRVFDSDGLLVYDAKHELTWYDAREADPERRPEWRLYYPAGPLETAEVDDLILIGRPGHDSPLRNIDLALYVIPWDSDLRLEIVAALRLGDPTGTFTSRTTDVLAQAELFALQEETLRILEPALVEASEPDEFVTLARDVFSDFFDKPGWDEFPSPRDLAELAQSRLSVDLRAAPDDAFVELVETETRVFHVLEQFILEGQLDEGFESVEHFLTIALRVLQRRKARRGRSIELHLAYLFTESGLAFEPQVRADGDTTVDFLFPGLAAYAALGDGAERGCGVLSLAAKSTIKERWRQVLREARKLRVHHLCTVQPGISENQLVEMRSAGVVLVVPPLLRQSYPDAVDAVISLADFIGEVRAGTA
jgi:hypothetical protein